MISKKENPETLKSILSNSPRAENRIKTGEYMGVCIVQSPGAWTRIGPTWLTPVGWINVGPGVSRWGTKLGLGELAVSITPTPSLHAVSLTISPTPNLVYAVGIGIENPNLKIVKSLAEEVEKYEAKK
jgi:hypothetical protein